MRLVLDFDGTLTVQDTIGALADAAIAFQRARHGTDLRPQWEQAVHDYLSDLSRFSAAYVPAEPDRRDAASELRFLTALGGVEHASLDRVERTGIFAGAARDDMFRMGRAKAADGTVRMRRGFGEMLRLARARGWPARVLSVNWSRAFIEGVLDHHGVQGEGEGEGEGVVVLANEVGVDGRIRGPAGLGRRLATAADKMECLARMGEGLYVGDSPADLGCLLRGKGVVMADDAASPLLRTLARVGVRVPHVGDAAGEAKLAWARDFCEVLQSKMIKSEGDVSSKDCP